jgi:exodeoxyribonuclease VII small subunit
VSNFSNPAEAYPQKNRQVPPDLNDSSHAIQDAWNYEATVKKVEAIMARIETGELELAAVFDQFETAVGYLRQCDLFLKHHQQQMDLLIETLIDDADS